MTDAPLAYWLRGGTGPNVVLPCIDWLFLVCYGWLIIVILMTVPLQVLSMEYCHWSMTLVECVRWVLFIWLISVCHLEWLVSNSNDCSFTGEYGLLLNLGHCHWSMTLVECVRWVLFVWLISVCHLEWLVIVILMTVPLQVLNLEYCDWSIWH